MRMSMSEKYLNHLQNKGKMPLTNEDVSNMIKTVPYINKTEIFVDKLFLNLNKMDALHFNPKVKMIYFTSVRELSELYYYHDKQLYKVGSNTTIVSKNLRHFAVAEMNQDIDGIMV